MKKNLISEIELSEGITANIEGNELTLKKENNEIKQQLNKTIDIKVHGNKIILEAKKITKREKKILGTFEAHIKNMIKGLNERFKYRLQVVAVHFPITASIDKEKNEFVVKNFLGEKIERRMKIIPGVEVKIEKDIIEISSINRSSAGQFAANIEKGTHIRKKDRRIFQDGIYIIEKPGRSFL
jgi:large subunit ribosomal protein L6